MRASMHPVPFVRVRVPGALERSLQLSLGAVHAPFFTVWDSGAVVLTLQEGEWARVASKFLSATVERGLRLISIDAMPDDPVFIRRLADLLTAAGVPASALPAFHRDHLVIRAEHADRCLAAIAQLAASEPEQDR